MSAGKTGRDKYNRGVSKEKFDLITSQGLTQASGTGGTPDLITGSQFQDKLEKARIPTIDTSRTTDPKKLRGQRERRQAAIDAEEERKANFFKTISQKDLDELVVNFNTRRSSLIQRSQFQGRDQLIRTDR